MGDLLYLNLWLGMEGGRRRRMSQRDVQDERLQKEVETKQSNQTIISTNCRIMTLVSVTAPEFCCALNAPV
jgi:hypothetical protein